MNEYAWENENTSELRVGGETSGRSRDGPSARAEIFSASLVVHVIDYKSAVWELWMGSCWGAERRPERLGRAVRGPLEGSWALDAAGFVCDAR